MGIKKVSNFTTQRYLHKPEDNQNGDCWAACISSLTGIPLDEVPDPNSEENKEWPVYWVNMYKFLQQRGFDMCCINVSEFKEEDYCIAVGKSPRCIGVNSDLYHAVIWNKGIVHDPHPDRTGILTIDHFEVIEKLTDN